MRSHWLNDAFYMFFNGILIKAGLLVVVGGALILIGYLIPDSVGQLVQSQPVWLQAIEVIVVADIGFYLAHRAFHAFPSCGGSTRSTTASRRWTGWRRIGCTRSTRC